VLIALSVMMALVVAIPVASGKPPPPDQKPSPPGQSKQPPGQLKKNLPELTAEWWNWAASMDPSPLEGSYENTSQCDGEYVEGVFFLAGAAFDPDVPEVERTCTVPANTPIFFPIVNVVCSAAFDAFQNPDDPRPLDTACAEPVTDDVIDPPSEFFATLDGQDLQQQRIASGLFQWTIKYPDNPYPQFVPGTYESASDGLWVFLRKGLKRGEHTIEFGGTFKDTPFGDFEGTHVTYHLTAVNKAGR
jgi:hypothetical protein